MTKEIIIHPDRILFNSKLSVHEILMVYTALQAHMQDCFNIETKILIEEISLDRLIDLAEVSYTKEFKKDSK